MSRHKNLVTTNLSFFASPEKCHDINFFVESNIFAFNSFTLLGHNFLCCDIIFYVATFHLGYSLPFVTTIFSFVAIEFLIFSCCYCRDRPFLCRDTVLLSCTVETKLCIMTDSKDVATYFLL